MRGDQRGLQASMSVRLLRKTYVTLGPKRTSASVGPVLSRPTAQKNLPTPVSLFCLKAAVAAEVHRSACEPQGTRGGHRVHSGTPAFRRPSITSFLFLR